MGTSIVANLSNDDALLQDDYSHGRSSTTKRRKHRSSTSHSERPMATKKKAKRKKKRSLIAEAMGAAVPLVLFLCGLSVASGRRDLGVATHRDVSQAVAVLAERHEVRDGAVLPIAVNVVQENDFRVRVVAAVSALPFVDLPSILFVAARSLSTKRIAVPSPEHAFAAAESTASFAFNEASLGNSEPGSTLKAGPLHHTSIGLSARGASARAEPLRRSSAIGTEAGATAVTHLGRGWSLTPFELGETKMVSVAEPTLLPHRAAATPTTA